MVMRYSEMVTGDKFQISEFVCCDFALLVNMVQRSLIKFPRGHVWYWNYIWLQNIIHTQVGSDGEVGLGDFGSSGVVVVIRGGVVV